MAVFGCCIAAVVHWRKKWSRRRWQERGPGSSRSRPPSWSLSFSYRRWNVFLSASFHRPKSNGRHSRWTREGSPARPLDLDLARPMLHLLCFTVSRVRSRYRCVLRNSTKKIRSNGAAHVRLDDGIVSHRLFTCPLHLAWLSPNSIELVRKFFFFQKIMLLWWMIDQFNLMNESLNIYKNLLWNSFLCCSSKFDWLL